LPSNEETQEDFAWLAREIVELGGEVLVCEAQFVEGLNDRQLTEMFVTARNEDYARLDEEARDLERRLASEASGGELNEVAGQVARPRKQLSEVAAIDFFAADGRDATERRLAGLEARLQEGSEAMNTEQGMSTAASALASKVWVTREHVQIDRIASAWLIRRFIDPKARFKFVPGRSYTPRQGEGRFDMFEGEDTHEGGRCPFEGLVAGAGVHDPAP